MSLIDEYEFKKCVDRYKSSLVRSQVLSEIIFTMGFLPFFYCAQMLTFYFTKIVPQVNAFLP